MAKTTLPEKIEGSIVLPSMSFMPCRSERDIVGVVGVEEERENSENGNIESERIGANDVLLIAWAWAGTERHVELQSDRAAKLVTCLAGAAGTNAIAQVDMITC